MKWWKGLVRRRLSVAAWAVLVVVGYPSFQSRAQEEPSAEIAAAQPEGATEQPATDAVPAETDLFAPEQLDILVAPVALYPDPLLVLILQGSTFPVDVVAAHRFLGKVPEQPDLQPDADWDTSIVGLLNYPDVVARMDEELDWTEALGEAVLNQLGDVQGSIQQVRLQAYAAGMLVTDEHQVVTGSPDLIIVLPADETQIFVPTYDPAAVLAAEPVPLPPVEPEPAEAVAEAPPEPEPVEAVAEAPAELPPETYAQPATAPATYQGPEPLPPVYASAPPVVQYSDPSPSFWSGAATFAGGAAVGGLLGYVIGDDDNDWDWNDDDDWDDIADDVDDIADDLDDLNEGLEDFRDDADDRLDELAEEREERFDEAGERLDEAADERQERREDRAGALAEQREQRADRLDEAAQTREKKKQELRDKHQKHQAQQVQDQLRQRKGLPETGGDRASRQRVASPGDGSATVAGLAPASVKRRADAPGLMASGPSAGTTRTVRGEAGGSARTTLSPTLAKAEAARPAPTRPGAQVAAAKPRSAFSAPKPAREVKKQSVRGAASRSSSNVKAIAHGGSQRAVARSGGQRPSAARGGGGRSKSALANSHHGGSKVKKAASRGKASRGGGRGGKRRR